MTVRRDLAAILGRVAEDASPEKAAGLIIDYFYRLENKVTTRHASGVGRDLTEIVQRVRNGVTPDQVSRLVIRRLHDIGIIDMRYGWLDDDPEMVQELADNCDALG